MATGRTLADVDKRKGFVWRQLFFWMPVRFLSLSLVLS
jgi:hypothetical protein